MAEGESPAAATSARPSADYTPAPFDEDGPIWPDEVSEAAFLAESGPGGSNSATAETAPASLPSLEQLVARVGEPARSLLEELFRARFVSVKRIQPGWLKDTAP